MVQLSPQLLPSLLALNAIPESDDNADITGDQDTLRPEGLRDQDSVDSLLRDQAKACAAVIEDQPSDDGLGEAEGERVNSVSGSPVFDSITGLEFEGEVEKPRDGKRDPETHGLPGEQHLQPITSEVDKDVRVVNGPSTPRGVESEEVIPLGDVGLEKVRFEQENDQMNTDHGRKLDTDLLEDFHDTGVGPEFADFRIETCGLSFDKICHDCRAWWKWSSRGSSRSSSGRSFTLKFLETGRSTIDGCRSGHGCRTRIRRNSWYNGSCSSRQDGTTACSSGWDTWGRECKRSVGVVVDCGSGRRRSGFFTAIVT